MHWLREDGKPDRLIPDSDDRPIGEREGGLDGVYAITCMPQRRVYVGLATGGWGDRVMFHIRALERSGHVNLLMQSDFNRYRGIQGAFWFHLCQCGGNQVREREWQIHWRDVVGFRLYNEQPPKGKRIGRETLRSVLDNEVAIRKGTAD